METHEVKTKKTPLWDLFLRTIAVLGLIAILLLGAWGIIQLAFAIPSVFGDLGESISSLFTHSTTTTTAPAAKESITVTLPATTSSGAATQVSWLHSNSDTSGQYSYAISYACATGITVKAPLPTGSYQAVPCNTAFNYVNATEHMNLVPTLVGSAPATLTVTVTATKLSTGAVTAQGSASTNVTAGTATQTTTTKPVTTTTTKPTTQYYPAATRAVSLYGYGDLAVTITSVLPSTGLTTIHFTVANVGTNIVNSGWTFNATLPINGSYTFGSQPQQALYPGDKIAYTLSFAGGNTSQTYGGTYGASGYAANGYTTSGYTCQGYTCNNNNVVVNGYPYGNTTTYGYQTGTITITADPQNYIPEYNKGNNTAQTTVPLY
jgi:hypothetical protein